MIKKKKLDIEFQSNKSHNKQLVKVTRDMEYREFFRMRMSLLVRLQICNNYMLEEFIESRKLESKIEDFEDAINKLLIK